MENVAEIKNGEFTLIVSFKHRERHSHELSASFGGQANHLGTGTLAIP
jgi:hypothetical protein